MFMRNSKTFSWLFSALLRSLIVPWQFWLQRLFHVSVTHFTVVSHGILWCANPVSLHSVLISQFIQFHTLTEFFRGSLCSLCDYLLGFQLWQRTYPLLPINRKPCPVLLSGSDITVAFYPASLLYLPAVPETLWPLHPGVLWTLPIFAQYCVSVLHGSATTDIPKGTPVIPYSSISLSNICSVPI